VQHERSAAAADVTIRPMLARDAPAARAAASAALQELCPQEELSAEQEREQVASGTARAAHLQRTDPAGCWVAEHDGEIVGTALGLIREGVWGFSLFGVRPGYQGLGIGSRLYAPAHEYGAGARGGIILSSSHPAAMRRYALSPGYRLIPTVGLSGAWNPSRLPAGLRCRPGDLAADADTIEAASRHVRGASHLRDLPALLERPGSALLVVDGDGYACARDGHLTLLAARTEAAATDLLWGAFASGRPGATVSVEFISAANQWAIAAGLAAGLALTTCGPIFVRGELGTLAPFLPNGAYL
jgi:GNAT superfamily N-acetyltransferase